ncbi:hypothetical protein E2C01_032493 [Portunus trituberculatus]|uniref:Uncharacterized protein n=1 Tax=Portunus trituberculatus TaxID=210409 RepID=A0A5B7F2Y7_PORTR|nr:hypothetical protein [Portunus trituberculatus]
MSSQQFVRQQRCLISAYTQGGLAGNSFCSPCRPFCHFVGRLSLLCAMHHAYALTTRASSTSLCSTR